MADDDRALMERLAALEAEVKADADAQQARKAAAAAKLRAQRAAQVTERDALRARQAALVTKQAPREEPAADEEDERPRRRRAAADPLEDLGGALELASKANRVKEELARPTQQGDKSWKISAIASLALGPIGWLYAGSWREAAPAAAGWFALALVASKILPVFLMLPVLMVVAPLSAIAGVMYTTQYNRTGKRQRLFGDKTKTKPKQLRSE